MIYPIELPKGSLSLWRIGGYGKRRWTADCNFELSVNHRLLPSVVRWRIRQRPQTIENISRVRRQIFNMFKIWRRQNIRCDSVHVSLATATLISLTLPMPWKTVCSRYEVITYSQVFVGVRCQRLLTNKQRKKRHVPNPDDTLRQVTTWVWRLLANFVRSDDCW